MDDSKLIFIVSQPRAGSTLLQAVLSNNDRIDTISEPWLLLPIISILNPSLNSAVYDYQLAYDAMMDFLEKTNQVEDFKRDLKNIILQRYSKLSSRSNNMILDKTPRYYEILEMMLYLFPKAKYIILKRHPLAVMRSIMKTWGRNKIKDLAISHKRDLIDAPFIIQSLTKKLNENVNVRIIKFEDLVKNPDLEIKSLCKWLGLKYSSEMLDYSNNLTFHGKYGDLDGVKERSIPDSTNLDNWKLDLKNKPYKDYLNGYGAYLGKEFLKEYGYNDDLRYKSNLKFKAFQYYCHRSQVSKMSNIKDYFVSFLIKQIYREEL